jgi:hypothetical protein
MVIVMQVVTSGAIQYISDFVAQAVFEKTGTVVRV